MRGEGGGDKEQDPGESHGGEADSTQEPSTHFRVHGSYSHTCQGHRKQPLDVTLVAVTLHEIHEAVKQACGGRQQQE